MKPSKGQVMPLPGSAAPSLHGTLQRACVCGASAGLSGTCAAGQHKKLASGGMQRKLVVNEPGDACEQEADRVAEQVMLPPEPSRDGAGKLAGSKPAVQRRLGGSEGPATLTTPPAVDDVLSSPGRPLDSATRVFWEDRFGCDFSRVRVHADGRAARSAQLVDALAYTVGRNIVFGAGQYSPGTQEGRRLMAHELAHVLQQGSVASSQIVQRSPVFPDDSCDKQGVREKITGALDQSLALVQQAIAALAEPQTVAGPLKRFFSVETEDRVALYLIRENLQKLERKLAGPVNTYCQTVADYRREHDTAPPRGYAELDENGRPRPDSPITFNRNIFRLTGATTHRQVVNTILHEYAHLAGIGHGEEIQGSPMENENSTQVRGLSTEQAINSAEVTMRFVRAVAGREDRGRT